MQGRPYFTGSSFDCQNHVSSSTSPGGALRPQKAFQASWQATGYFEAAHFEGGVQMTHEEACRTLAETGMLQAFELPSDRVGEEMHGNRLGVGNLYHRACIASQQKNLVHLTM